ncbi:hypothetical protein [Arthrobacter pigmenti]
MSRDFDDDEHKEFITAAGSWHTDPADGHWDEAGATISQAAWRLHAWATVTSLCEGNFGFVPDNYLSSIRAETDLTAFELVSVVLWERAGDGYVIRDPYMLDLVLRADDYVRQTRGWTMNVKNNGRS